MNKCACGCGNDVYGTWKHGHWTRSIDQRGKKNANWKGGRTKHSKGYMLIANGKGLELEHRAICEQVLGRSLPAKAKIHHWDGLKSENRNGNLVICEDTAYHGLLHRRQRALAACGNADWRKCPYCQQWDPPSAMWIGGKNHQFARHRSCTNQYKRALRIRKQSKET